MPGGTGLYRHHPTGLERLPNAVNSDIVRLAEQHGMNFGVLQRGDSYAEFMNTVMFNPAMPCPAMCTSTTGMGTGSSCTSSR